MLMLRAYFDETGTDVGQTVIGVGGVIASLASWERLETEWNSVLSRHGIGKMHMSEFAHSTGEFQKWLGKENEEERRTFLGALVNATCNNVCGVFGGAVLNSAFQGLTEVQRDYMKDPYWPCLQVCFDCAAHRARDFNEKVHIYVAHQPEFAARVARNYDMLKSQLDLPRINGVLDPVGAYLDSFTIQGSDVVPMQVADLVAYEMHKEVRRQVDGDTRSPRWAIEQFKKGYGRIEILHSVESLLAHLPKSIGGTAG